MKQLNKTQEIILYLVDLIKSKKVIANQILPSEHFLMVKFDCSRITVVSAYSKLKSIGAIYSITKKGHFVAENFYSAISSISNAIATDYSTIEENKVVHPHWFSEFKIKFDYGFKSYVKKYFKNDQFIMEAEYYISNKYKIVDIEKQTSIIEYFQEKVSIINNVVYKLRYEICKNWDNQKLVVIYMFGYDEEGIMISSKYIIHPDHFQFSKQEFSII